MNIYISLFYLHLESEIEIGATKRAGEFIVCHHYRLVVWFEQTEISLNNCITPNTNKHLYI